MSHRYLIGRGFFKKSLEQVLGVAQPGDTLILDPGVYEIGEQVIVDNLSIRGSSSDPQQVIWKGSMSTQGDVKLENLSVQMDKSLTKNDFNTALNISNGSVNCLNCYFNSSDGENFTVFCDSGTNSFFNQCTVTTNNNIDALKGYGNAQISLINSLVGGIELDQSATINVKDSQITGDIELGNQSKLYAENIYSASETEMPFIDIESGSQFIAGYLNLAAGNTRALIKHGLLDVKTNNIDDLHRLLYTADEQSTVNCSHAELMTG